MNLEGRLEQAPKRGEGERVEFRRRVPEGGPAGTRLAGGPRGNLAHLYVLHEPKMSQ